MIEISIPPRLSTPFEEECVYTCDYSAFERMIMEAFGHTFSLVADQELSNGSTWACTVDGKLDEYDEVEVYKFSKIGEYHYAASCLLNYLCQLGVIRPGKYIIDVYW